MNHTITNGQKELKRRRENMTKVNHISDINPMPKRIEPIDIPAIQETIEPAKRVMLSDLDTSHPLVKTAVDAARGWAKRKQEHPDASLILCGPYGVGKTHIAKAILWSMCYTLDGGIPVAPSGKFWVSNDLIQSLGASTYTRDLIGSVPIVVIDDVGREQGIEYIGKDNQWRERQGRFFKVIDYCYTYQITIVITSNLSINELAEWVGGASWDRLNEMAPKGYMIDLAGVPSYRIKTSGR